MTPETWKSFNMRRIITMSVLLGMPWVSFASTNTQSSVFKHPVLERWRSLEDVNKKRLEGVAQEIMKLSDAQVLALIPEQTPRIHHQCPVCARKKPVTTLPEQPQPFPGVFDPLKPAQVQCKTCKTIFPNDAFPITQSQVFRNMLGEDITVLYWEDKEGGRTLAEKIAGKTHRLYMRGIVDTARKLWLLPRMDAVAQLYQATHDERYAKRLIYCLDALAQRYPHYLLTTDYGHHYTTTLNQKYPYGYIDTRWGRRSGEDLPSDLLELFDLAASSPSLDRATKERIRANLFLDPLKRLDRAREGEGNDAIFGNSSALRNMIQLALVLEDPERVHTCYQAVLEVPRYVTGCDGLYNQSPGYSSLFRMTFVGAARLLDGYSDPQGFVGKDGLHLDNIRPLVEMEEFYRCLCTTGPDQLRLPSGGWLSYDDSGPGFGPTWWSGCGESCRPLEKSVNVLLPGLRRATLGAGTGDKQIQVSLDFAEHGVNHGHQSGLTLQIFAFGHSLVDDFPYHKSQLRRYGQMTIGHQTVVINQQNQKSSYTRGDVELFAPLMDGVSVIRVDNTRAYSDLASRYARTLILNASDPNMPYVIDVFEVTGGTTHDYHLRSSSQHHSSGTSSLATQAVPGLRPLLPAGETWVEPRKQGDSVGSGYGVLFDVNRAMIPGVFHFSSVCDDPWAGPSFGDKSQTVGAFLSGTNSWASRPAIGIRSHVAVGSGYEFISATSPSLVEGGFAGVEGRPSDQWPRIPHRILRHTVKEGESSVFVVVHEPYYHTPKITSVTRLDKGDDKRVALRIESPGRMDTLLYALDKSRTISVGEVTMTGRIGLVSQQEKQKPRACLIAGSRLKAEGVELTCAVDNYSGSIVALERRWKDKGVNRLKVATKTALPVGDALRGAWLIAKLGPWKATVIEEHNEKMEKQFAGATQAFEIDHVEHTVDGTWVYLNGDHGLSLSNAGIEEFYWPRRTFAGTAGFVIPTAVTTHPAPLPPRSQPLVVKPAASASRTLIPGVHVAYFQGSGHDCNALKSVSSSVVQNVDTKLIASIELPGAVRMEGYLRVPVDGIYTFHFGASDEYRMTLEKAMIIESLRGYNLIPDTRQVQLAAGLYALTLECFRVTNRMPSWFTADWEGPGLPRQSFIPSLLTP